MRIHIVIRWWDNPRVWIALMSNIVMAEDAQHNTIIHRFYYAVCWIRWIAALYWYYMMSSVLDICKGGSTNCASSLLPLRDPLIFYFATLGKCFGTKQVCA